MSAPGLTPQEIALAIIPHITGGLSMLGSAYITFTVLSNEKKRGKTYHRLLVAMSLSDIVSSFSYFLSTWPIPQVGHEGVGGWSKACDGCSPYHYASVGTDATCAAQGFGMQFGMMTTATYNVMLAIHYLLTIRWSFSEARLKSKVEPYMLAIPPLIGLALSLPEIFLNYYNNTNLWCWIKASWEYEDAVQRTYDARWSFAYGPLWAFIVCITLTQIYLWWTVKKIERKTMRYTSYNTSRAQTKQSRRVAEQAALYVGVFYVTNLPYTIIAATRRFYNPHTAGGFAALLFVVMCAPLQGFLNLFVYRRQTIITSAKRSTVRAGAVLQNAGKSFRPRAKVEHQKSNKQDGNLLPLMASLLPPPSGAALNGMENGNGPNTENDSSGGVKGNISELGGGEHSEELKDENMLPSSGCRQFIPSHISEVYEEFVKESLQPVLNRWLLDIALSYRGRSSAKWEEDVKAKVQTQIATWLATKLTENSKQMVREV
ncbi:hypothetical protein ACHAWF_001785 [Thalassiosira exigua]